jgi:hypothetical protein
MFAIIRLVVETNQNWRYVVKKITVKLSVKSGENRMKNILITTEGIQKNLKNIKPLDAICEYIWNGFDANASCVRVELHTNEMDLINIISIIDNGTGIAYEELIYKFQPFNESKKAGLLSRTNHSLPHGRHGIGRLTFFSFAQTARWDTVYEKEGKNYKYYISMNKDLLNKYDDNNGVKPTCTEDLVGTNVRFTQLISLSKEDIIEEIQNEFFWFLELNKNKNYQIWVDEQRISYEEIVMNRMKFDMEKFDLSKNYSIEFVQWNKSLGKEFSKMYFVDSKDREKYKEATKLNNKSDEFYHSVYIKSSYFDEFYFNNTQIEGQYGLFPNKNETEFKTLINSINYYLIKCRKKYLKEASEKYIDGLIKREVYPEFNPNNFLDIFRKKELDNLVETLFMAQPKIFTGLHDDNKKVTIHLLQLIMDNSNKPELFDVLKQVIDLDEDELRELASVLQYTTLNNITKIIKLLQDRLRVVQGLKEIVFEEKRFTKEVEHLQEVVEAHYWLFGEQYSLITSAEPDFELALKGLLIKTVGDDSKVTLEHEDKNKEMDIYMVRQDRNGNITENVVVELKRPTVPLGEAQLSQVKKYMRVIKSDDRFNAHNVKWTYYLVGNKFNQNGYMKDELESHRNLGEPHLVHADGNGNNKIYVLTWSDIFDDFSKRHEYLMSKMEVERELWLKRHDSVDETVKDIKENSATLENAVIPKRAIK